MSDRWSVWATAMVLFGACLLNATASGAACQTWQIVPSPVISQASLQAVSWTSSTDVWTVGIKFYSPGQPVILHWAGTAWRDTPKEKVNGNLYDVSALTPTDAWAVGDGDNQSLPLSMHWDGTSWKGVRVPAGGEYDQLFGVQALASNDVWAVGQFIHHWDGSSWTVYGPSAGTLNAIDAVSPDDIWAVGFTGAVMSLVEHWDGVAWSVVQVPPPAGGRFQDVAAISADDVWATGWVGTFQDPLTEHFDGTAWSIVDVPVDNGLSLNGVSGTSSNDVWAVGAWRNITVHWDGAAWTGFGFSGPNQSDFVAVAAIAPDDIWAVGSQVPQPGLTPLIEHSNGPCP